MTNEDAKKFLKDHIVVIPVTGRGMTHDQQLIHDFVEEVHARVKLDTLGGNPFHRQMETIAHERGAWEEKEVNFGCFGGKMVPK